MIYCVGYDDLGRRSATMHEQPGGVYTIHVFNHDAPPSLFSMPNLREALSKMKQSGCTLIISAPADLAIDFVQQFSEALSA